MSSSEQFEAIKRNLDGVVRSLVDAWISLRLLEGLHAVGKDISHQPGYAIASASNFYRSAFTAIYIEVGTILDTSDGVHSIQRLLERLRSFWSADADLLAVVEEIQSSLATNDVLTRLKSWRNKVIAHRTEKTNDQNFYTENQVNLGEIAASLTLLEESINRLSVNIDGTVHYGLSDSVPGLADDVQRLFQER